MLIELSNGLDIPMAGAPAQAVDAGADIFSVALHGADYRGLKPRLTVAAGDRVTLGQELFHDKRDPAVPFTAPGTGTVTAIHRGPRRSLSSIVIELDENGDDNDSFRHITGTAIADWSADAARSELIKAGLWTAFRTRPFSKVPQSNSLPNSIFVTAMDTRPLAADPRVVVDMHKADFVTGLQVLARQVSTEEWRGCGASQLRQVGVHPAPHQRPARHRLRCGGHRRMPHPGFLLFHSAS